MTATYTDGELVLTTASGDPFAVLPLDDTDHEHALELLDAGHGIGQWPFASFVDLVAVLERNGWRRVTPWSGERQTPRATVQPA